MLIRTFFPSPLQNIRSDQSQAMYVLTDRVSINGRKFKESSFFKELKYCFSSSPPVQRHFPEED